MSVRQRFEAIGTVWTIALGNDAPATVWRDLQTRIAEFDRCYSRFRADSLVSQMAQRAGRYQLPSDAYPLLHFYERLYRATDGLVTPLIGQTMVDAGYDAEYSLQPKSLAAPPAWDEVIDYDEHSITLTQPALLDFGAAGKGYLVDIVAGQLRAAGISEFVINAGGDILHQGSLPLAIGLENPLDTSEVIGTVELRNQSLAASAGSRRAWREYHHIINPHNLRSPKHVLATWVQASDCMTADGLATALFLVPPARLAAFHFGYAILRPDMSLEQSNLAANIFTVA